MIPQKKNKNGAYYAVMLFMMLLFSACGEDKRDETFNHFTVQLINQVDLFAADGKCEMAASCFELGRNQDDFDQRAIRRIKSAIENCRAIHASTAMGSQSRRPRYSTSASSQPTIRTPTPQRAMADPPMSDYTQKRLVEIKRSIREGDCDFARSYYEIIRNHAEFDDSYEIRIEREIQKCVKEAPEVYGLEFYQVTEGEYYHGTPQGEFGRENAKEIDVKKVKIKGFFVSTTEVPQKTYVRYMFDPDGQYKYPNLPMYNITFDDAEKFCEVLSKEISGYQFSLPDEIEWEICCRAGTHPDTGPVNAPGEQKVFLESMDKAEHYLKKYAYFSKNKTGSLPMKIKGKLPNAWGLYDMHGNVAEWCRPAAGFDIKPGCKPHRGGSVHSEYKRCRAGARAFEPEQNKSVSIGFRIIAWPE